MSEIKIDKGVPIPKIDGLGRHHKYPWHDLNVGDSFFVPNATTRRFCSSVNRIQKTLGISMKCRTVTENDIKGVRIWRIK